MRNFYLCKSTHLYRNVSNKQYEIYDMITDIPRWLPSSFGLSGFGCSSRSMSWFDNTTSDSWHHATTTRRYIHCTSPLIITLRCAGPAVYVNHYLQRICLSKWKISGCAWLLALVLCRWQGHKCCHYSTVNHHYISDNKLNNKVHV